MKKFTNQDYGQLRNLGKSILSPDGRYVVYAVRSVNLEKDSYETRLFAADLNTGEELQLTDGPQDSPIGFLPDGRLLFTASGREDSDPENGTAVWAMPMTGEDAGLWMTVPVPGAILFPVDEERYLVLTDEDRNPEEDRQTAQWIVYEEYPLHAEGFGYASRQRTTIQLYSGTDNTLTPLLPEDLHVMIPFFSPAVLFGERGFWFAGACFRGDRNGHEGVWYYDWAAGKAMELFNGPYYYYAFARWAGKIIAHSWVCSGERVGTMHLVSVPETGGEAEVNDSIEWFPEAASGEWFIRVWQARPKLCRWNGDFSAFSEVETPGVFPSGVLPLPDGGAVVTGWETGHQSELWILKEGRLSRLTHLNDGFYAEYTLSRPQPLRAGGVEGWVIPPVCMVGGKKYPVVVYTHGGPHGYSNDRLIPEHQRFANEGYFFIFCNPHGSTTYGIEHTCISGHCGDTDYREIMRFLDGALEAWPEMDAERMAFMGQSYGGFMANWVAGHTDRFRAICARMAISNWISLRGVSDEKWYLDACLGATPWTNPGKCWEQSPLKYVRQVHTPLLIIQHEKDNSVPLEQGEEMLTPLLEMGVPARMVVNLGCGHGGKKPSQTLHDIDAMLAWFRRWLHEEETEEPEKEG